MKPKAFFKRFKQDGFQIYKKDEEHFSAHSEVYFNENGILIESIDYTYASDGSLKNGNTNKYNENGDMIEKIYYSPSYGDSFTKYDENGKVIEEQYKYLLNYIDFPINMMKQIILKKNINTPRMVI